MSSSTIAIGTRRRFGSAAEEGGGDVDSGAETSIGADRCTVRLFQTEQGTGERKRREGVPTLPCRSR